MQLGNRLKIHVEPPMSALSDIIFMLLIFFIMASTLAVTSEKINLPKTGTGESNTASTRLTVSLDGVGEKYAVNGQEVAKGDVTRFLQAFMSTRDDKKIILVIDSSVPTGTTVELFSMMKVNNWQPVIATQKLNPGENGFDTTN
jgi:biopolymer transport protein ExbD